MQRLIKWFANKVFPEKERPVASMRQSGAKVKPRPVRQMPRRIESVEFNGGLGGRIEDGGPGKNVLIRNKYVREDTGTHDTLKIIDDSILESDEEHGLDPYNTGRFDRAKSWNSSRSRK
jgi:hypothetical protein